MKEKDLALRERYILLGLNVKYYRGKLGLTQDELAEKAGLSRGVVARLEAPDMYYSPATKTLFKLADALEISTYKLFRFRDIDEN